MKRRRPNPFSPYFAWTDLAFKAGEMAVASAAVIACRTERMAKSSIPPSARDAEEFSRMGQEKVEAAQEQAVAVSQHMMAVTPYLALRSAGHLFDVSRDMLSLVSSLTPGQVVHRQAKLGRTLLGHNAASLSKAAAKLADKALHPLHSRATANARRLSKIVP